MMCSNALTNREKPTVSPQPRSQGLFSNGRRKKALAPAGIFCNFIGLLPYTVNLFKTIYPHICVEKKLRVKLPTFNDLLSRCIT